MAPALARLYEKKTCAAWRQLAALQMDGYVPISVGVYGIVPERFISHVLGRQSDLAVQVVQVYRDAAGKPVEKLHK